MAKLRFMGANRTVTGSRHMLEVDGKKILVDCGMFQGKKENRLKNWDPFPVDPGDVDHLLFTHAHIDHTGYFPRFYRNGFAGNAHCTHASYDLIEILLRDSAFLQEEDAAWANKKGFSKHRPALPLYTTEDAENALKCFVGHHYGESLFIDNLRIKFKDAGHILGSSFIEIRRKDQDHSRKIVFSGDIGRPEKPLLRPPTQAYNVDYLVLESTYGNRRHEVTRPPEEALAQIINESVERGGVLVIPAFAVGRTQTLLYVIRDLEDQKKIPELNVFVDSPMGIDALKVFRKHISDMDLQSRVETFEGKKLFHPKRLKICRSRDESKSINAHKSRSIIISSSGMVTGGRILHHLAARLPDEKNTILFIGYQAEGTRGRAILEGKSEVKFHGRYVPVRAQIESVSGYSGHADYNEILAWLMGFNYAPKKTFLVHGEEKASEAMAEKIRSMFGWKVVIPSFGDTYEIDF